MLRQPFLRSLVLQTKTKQQQNNYYYCQRPKASFIFHSRLFFVSTTTTTTKNKIRNNHENKAQNNNNNNSNIIEAKTRRRINSSKKDHQFYDFHCRYLHLPPTEQVAAATETVSILQQQQQQQRFLQQRTFATATKKESFQSSSSSSSTERKKQRRGRKSRRRDGSKSSSNSRRSKSRSRRGKEQKGPKRHVSDSSDTFSRYIPLLSSSSSSSQNNTHASDPINHKQQQKQHSFKANLDHKNNHIFNDIYHGHDHEASNSKMNSNQNKSMPSLSIKAPPPLQIIVTPQLAPLTECTLLGTAGNTVVLVTVTSSTSSSSSSSSSSNDRQQLQGGGVPLVVDYKQRYHAVGQIPLRNANRTDNRKSTTLETLASRAIDRSLRPMIKIDNNNVNNIHVSCSVQSTQTTSVGATNIIKNHDNADNNNNDKDKNKNKDKIYSARHAISVAINTAAEALYQANYINNRIGAVIIQGLQDGTTLVDPPSSMILHDNSKLGELLLVMNEYDNIIMMEYSGNISEQTLLQWIQKGQQVIQDHLSNQKRNLGNDNTHTNADRKHVDDLDTENKLRLDLGLSPIDPEIADSSDATEDTAGALDLRHNDDNSNNNNVHSEQLEALYRKALHFCKQQLGDTPLRLFGFEPIMAANKKLGSNNHGSTFSVSIQDDSLSNSLLSKSIRGKREQIVYKEIERLLSQSFLTRNDIKEINDNTIIFDKYFVQDWAEKIHDSLLRRAFYHASAKYKCRSDKRTSTSANSNPCTTIRPISIQVPALPDVVHGSSLFTRGETQVLCTVTLGAPKDGILVSNDPYVYKPSSSSLSTQHGDEKNSTNLFQNLPVGSLRYLRTQEHLISDMNTRKVLADREHFGDSGTLSERQCAIFQYDFPAFSKGEVRSNKASQTSLREIGHGALAEKAISPILPEEFPYTIRMTSEVTSSNGSSSMASVCGITLALLDAGVPITAPVAGVSVGLVRNKKGVEQSSKNNDNNKNTHHNNYALLLDITGTEDHFGDMDFKVAGTESTITALQLDVKQQHALTVPILSEALELAKQGRQAILQQKMSAISQRPKLKDSAPLSQVIRFDPARKKDLIGPGGAVLKQLNDRFTISLDLSQEGQCLIHGHDHEMVKQARSAIMDLVSDVEIGQVYVGTIIEIRDFGMLIEILRNREGLCHVSQIASTKDIQEHPMGSLGILSEKFHVGQEIAVECIDLDPVEESVLLKLATDND